jgi:hypothetical protein
MKSKLWIILWICNGYLIDIIFGKCGQNNVHALMNTSPNNINSKIFNTFNRSQYNGLTWKETSVVIENVVDCNIYRFEHLSEERYENEFKNKKPFIVKSNNQLFKQVCEKEKLLLDYGEKIILLSSSDTKSSPKLRTTLSEYIQTVVSKPITLNLTGDNSLYHFGSHNFEDFAALFDKYVRPPFENVKSFIYVLCSVDKNSLFVLCFFLLLEL